MFRTWGCSTTDDHECDGMVVDPQEERHTASAGLWGEMNLEADLDYLCPKPKILRS